MGSPTFPTRAAGPTCRKFGNVNLRRPAVARRGSGRAGGVSERAREGTRTSTPSADDSGRQTDGSNQTTALGSPSPSASKKRARTCSSSVDADEPEELANAAPFPASDQSSFMTGSNMVSTEASTMSDRGHPSRRHRPHKTGVPSKITVQMSATSQLNSLQLSTWRST
jgi:hypothetical protein